MIHLLKESSNVLSFYVLVFSQACDTFKSALPSQLFFFLFERIFINVYGFQSFLILVMMGQMMNPNMVHVRQPFMGMGMQMQPRMMMMQPGMRMMRPGFQPY